MKILMNNDESRPDPDDLLNRINAEEEEESAQSSRGKLKIFFGACAGVGKTYAMLNAAQQALQEGKNVVVGIVETHGRKDTERLLTGMPVLPLKEIDYRGTKLKEFDIDAALAMKPELILIDELAHSNAPGSRHPKRWQDVDELINAGIDVYTTINVQHIESLNDVVARITGIWVKETVPDAFFDEAGAISLVDIPTEELLQRLKEGKVYIAPGAKKRAAQNFFKKSNLIALRELALRRTAERVDAQMDKYKTTGGAQQSWSGADRVLVCIGPDDLSSKLVRVAKRTSGSLKAPWTAVYVENDRHYHLSKEGQESVERTLRLAERMGGKTEIIKGGKAADDIVAFAKEHNYTKIIVGKKPRARWKEIVHGTLADNIIRQSGDIDVYVVTGDKEASKKIRTFLWNIPDNIDYYLVPLLTTLLCTLVAYPFKELTDPINLTSVYLVGVVLLALKYGRLPAFVSTAISAAAFNYFLLPPYFSFKLTDEGHLISLFVMVVTSLLIGTLTSKLRLQVIYARRRERNTAALYALSKDLTATRGKQNLVETAARHIGEILDSDISIWLPDEKGLLSCIMNELEDDKDMDLLREQSAANWAYTHKKPAGLGTETLPTAIGCYTPMISGNLVTGVIGVMPEAQAMLTNEQLNLLDTIANIAATAVERANAAELVERTLVESESEKLRNILLSSVSHDLRTPLASISGAASALLLDGSRITDEYKGELLRLIHEEAARLARMVTNLLDVTSLQTGSVKLNKELYFIEELIGSALMRVESKLGNRKVNINIQSGLPLVRMDGLLIEQVLINLFENIADHTPDDTQVMVRAEVHKPDMHVILEDNGPGVPEGDEERIFDRFYHASDSKEGALGLAICRGIIKAHNGKIWAQNRPEGGALFTFTLPLRLNEQDRDAGESRN
jgi:two-component system sensor histidine kinase KdpD